MDVKPHPTRKNRAVLTVERWEDEVCLAFATAPYAAAMKSWRDYLLAAKIARVNLLRGSAGDQEPPYDITLSHRELGSLAAKLAADQILNGIRFPNPVEIAHPVEIEALKAGMVMVIENYFDEIGQAQN